MLQRAMAAGGRRSYTPPMTETAEKPPHKASAAAALEAAAAYLDLWERHAAAVFRDIPRRRPGPDSESHAAAAPEGEDRDG